MPITFFDVIVVTIISISTILSMIRGFSRELFCLFSFLISTILSYLVYKKILILIKNYTYYPNFFIVVITFISFFFLLIFLSEISIKFSKIFLNNRFTSIDHKLGFVFGCIRGIFVVTVAILFMNILIKKSDQQNWIIRSKTKPIFDVLGNRLWNFLPKNIL